MDRQKVIDKLGGTTAVAKLCNVTSQAVSQWRKLGIPKARLMFLRVLRSVAIRGESGSYNEFFASGDSRLRLKAPDAKNS